jgi:hypothetical protein
MSDKIYLGFCEVPTHLESTHEEHEVFDAKLVNSTHTVPVCPEHAIGLRELGIIE